MDLVLAAGNVGAMTLGVVALVMALMVNDPLGRRQLVRARGGRR